MSVQAMAWALGQEIKPAMAKLLLVAVANYAGPTNECWPSKASLARDCSTDKSTVCKYLRQLRDTGHILIRERHQGGVNDTSIITLLVAENPPAERKRRRGSGASPTAGGPESGGSGPDTTTSGPEPTGVVGPSRHKPSYEPSVVILPGKIRNLSKGTYTRTRNAYARARDGGEL